MGNTFDRVMENKNMHSMKTRLNILSDYRNIIGICKAKKHRVNNYIFVITPKLDDQDNHESTDWEGGFNSLRKGIERRID